MYMVYASCFVHWMCGPSQATALLVPNLDSWIPNKGKAHSKIRVFEALHCLK